MVEYVNADVKLKSSHFHLECFFQLVLPSARAYTVTEARQIAGFHSLTTEQKANIQSRLKVSASDQARNLVLKEEKKARKTKKDKAKTAKQIKRDADNTEKLAFIKEHGHPPPAPPKKVKERKRRLPNIRMRKA